MFENIFEEELAKVANQPELKRKLKDEVGKLVIKYAEARIDPDELAAVLANAAMKVQFAYVQSIADAKKKFGDAGEEATNGFAS